MAEQIPLLEQYQRIKAAHRDEILFFRLGDFYEMFFDDAIEASALLNLTLTKRQEAPMCGIPYHAAKGYVSRLLRAGKKIAVCEQLAAPSKGKGIIERAVVETISPGTALDEDYLDSRSNNYLLAFGYFSSACALAWIDASTGEFRACSFPADDAERLRRELYRLSPREILVRESTVERADVARMLAENPGPVVNRYPDWAFSLQQGRSVLLAHFRTAGMKGFGFDDDDPALAAAGMALEYLGESLKLPLVHVTALKGAEDGERVAIDESSQKNLEIDRNLRDGGRAFTLLDTLDYTKTAMGARALRARLLRPLRSIEAINARLDAVESLYRDQRSLERVRRSLAACLDLERLAVRLAMDKSSARDLLAIRDSIRAAFALADALPAERPAAMSVAAGSRDRLEAFADTVGRALADEPSPAFGEGDIIRRGWNAELDAQRLLKEDAHGLLESYLEEERRATGLSGLRVKYNRIIGYYLELSRSSAQAVPPHFIRRQSMASGERYSTERLASLESDITGAGERIVEMERALFLSLREALKADAQILRELAAAIGEIDCAMSFATAATARGYSRPALDDSGRLEVRGGRHPVVEAHLGAGDFVPNDLSLDTEGASFALITGPNMAGKSTYLRQNALIVLMAQSGSFVPAASARIGAVDRIFCRVGAQDNLARGESTFLLEMHETAGILNNASGRSLVIMDEVGRGTGTQDGLAIAWAVSEHVMDGIGCRTLFATHYHELTAMRHVRLVDLSMAVEERAGEVVFLKRVVPGPAAGSYGIHVAGLAGVPRRVVDRASEIRAGLEEGERARAEARDGAWVAPAPRARAPDSGSLFSAEELALDELRSLDLDALSPLEALNRLSALQKRLGGRRR